MESDRAVSAPWRFTCQKKSTPLLKFPISSAKVNKTADHFYHSAGDALSLSRYTMPATARLSVASGRLFFLNAFHEQVDCEEPRVQCLEGHLNVTLPKAREIKSIEIKLISEAQVLSDGVLEKTAILLERTARMPNITKLEAGEHTLAFQLPVPCNAAPYDCTSRARIRQKVEARIKFTGLRLDLVVCYPIYFIANPCSPEELPDEFQLHVQNFSEDLGPYSAEFSSDALTVSSLLAWRLKLHNAPKEYSVNKVHAFIDQKVVLKEKTGSTILSQDRLPIFSMLQQTDNGRMVRPEPMVDAITSTLVDVNPLEEHSFTGFARLPSDQTMRPSTVGNCMTPIRIMHTITLECIYTFPSGRSRVLSISKPVKIASCACIATNLSLPAYTLDAKPVQSPAHTQLDCKCLISDGKLMARCLEQGLSAITYASKNIPSSKTA